MANLKSTRGAQTELVAEFTFDALLDSMPTTVGNTIAGATPVYNAAVVPIGGVASNVFDAIQLPPGAVVVGGDVSVEAAVAGPTASTISVGDAANATRYANAVSLLAAGRTALSLTGFRHAGENLRLTIANTVAAATVGKVTVRVMYTIGGRITEAQPN